MRPNYATRGLTSPAGHRLSARPDRKLPDFVTAGERVTKTDRVRSKIKGLVFIAVALGLLGRGMGMAKADPILLNGSFETYTVDPSLWASPGVYDTQLEPGNTNITGWTVIQGSIDYIATYWPAADGTRSLDLDGSPGSGGVSQTFATLPGHTYLVTFDLSGNPNHSAEPTDMTMEVQAAGQSQTYSYDTAVQENSFTNMKWESESFIFTANSTSTTLSLFSTTGVFYAGPALDNVAVADITPEPTTLIQLGPALLVFGGYRLLRRRRGAKGTMAAGCRFLSPSV